MEEEAVSVSNVDWPSYFASIVSVCPWSRAYWHKQKIDVQLWKSEILPLEDYVARMYIHKHASGRQLKKIMERMNEIRPEEEWLFSHPIFRGHSTPVPILIQQDLEILTKARKGRENGNAR